MKTTTKRLITGIGMIAVMGGSVMGQTTFNGGDISLGTSWSAGLPSAGNVGSIAADGTITAGTTLTDFVMTQTAGTISSASFGNPYTMSGGSFTLTGGTWGSNNRALTSTAGHVFTIDGGAYIGGQNDRTNIDGGTLIMQSGTLTEVGTNRGLVARNNGTITINGGTVNIDGAFGTDRLSGGSSNVINLNGGNITAAELFFGDNGSTTFVTFGGNTAGTFVANAYRAAGVDSENILARRVNWLPGSLMTMNLSTEASTWAQDEFDAGRLFYNGANNATLGLNWAQATTAGGLDGTYAFSFDDTTNTLSLSVIPEPSILALVGMGGAAALWMRRRRR